MKTKVAILREWLGRGIRAHQLLVSHEEAINDLNGDPVSHHLIAERDRLRACEASMRRNRSKLFQRMELSPRQFTVLYLHYVRYESWTSIANRLQIARRYALQIHKQALERLAAQWQPPEQQHA